MPDLLETAHGDVLVLTLNRPELRNALSAEMKAQLLAVLQRENDTPRFRALLLKGAGGAFCSGADARPGELLSRRDTIADDLRTGMNRIVTLMATLPYPVVAAVQGPAAGAGVGLALAADLLAVAPSARLHLSFARIGALPDAGTLAALTQKIGTSRATALALLGGQIDSDQAIDWGVAAKRLSEASFEADALAFAEGLAAGPTRAFALTKRLLASARQSDLATHLELEATLQAEAFASPDFEEGVRARAEKRAPRFTGR